MQDSGFRPEHSGDSFEEMQDILSSPMATVYTYLASIFGIIY